LGELFDSNQIVVENHALGGTSSRTFQTNGLWEKALARVRKGDFVIMQFGHNDSSPLDDTARARGTIKGIGPETKDIYNPIKKIPETVHSYGWYLNKFVTDIQQKGATAIICSPIPRNDWKEGKVNRANTGYGLWAKQVAEAANVPFIELNGLIADNYDVAGQEAVKQYFTEKDHTHTNDAGAKLNARIVADAIKDLKETNLKKYLLKSK
jgi:lysophospholipase L1-like esterase